MERRLPLLIAVLCVIFGLGVWLYRVQKTAAAPGGPLPLGPDVVRNAWTVGRKVALRGRQQIRMPDPKKSGATVTLIADVLRSRDGQVRIEYTSETLKGVRIWENGDRTYRYSPRRNRLTVSQKRRTAEEQAERELELLERNHISRVIRSDEIAGHPAWVVEIRPRSSVDRWKRLWVDQKTWVILESEDLQGQQGLSRRTTFTQITYLDPNETLAESEFKPPADLLEKLGQGDPESSPPFEDLAALSKLVGFRIREPKALPSGFVMEGAHQVPCICGKKHRAVRIQYTDGLNSFSVFETGHPECPAPKGGVEAGPMATATKQNGVYFWAYGDLPRTELKRIIESAAGS